MDNVAVMLAREGLATVSEYGQDRITFSRELQTAEQEAKTARKNVRQFHINYVSTA